LKTALVAVTMTADSKCTDYPLITFRSGQMKTFMKWFGIGFVILLIAFSLLTVLNRLLPEGWILDANIFVFLAGAILSLTWTFLPKVREQFASLSSGVKILVNLILMLVLSGLIILFSCINWFPVPGVSCSLTSAKELIAMVIWAVIGNQITYVASPQPTDVKTAKHYRFD
jgi:uncharacterized membrane protein YjfL (UPF0719 family)